MNKIKKAKGPIRTEAVVPMFIVVGLIWGYFFFFFDSHLKWGIEYGLTKVNGAEVDVRSLQTSFIRGSFELNGLEFTDKETPERNALEIGRMHFKFLWDALLRMKFVVEDASIEQFLVNTKRAKPGRVLPKTPDPEIEKVEGEAQGSALADAGKLIQGAVPSLNPDELDNLESLKKIKSLQTELPAKQKEWEESIKSLPNEKDLNDLRTRIGNLKVGGTSNPLEIQKQISEASSLISEINQKTNDIKTKASNIQSDIGRFTQEVNGINKIVEQDIKTLESKLKLPRLDVESLSKQFFGPQIMGYVRMAKQYLEMAQKNMPPTKSKEEREADKIVAHKREAGKNYEFPRVNSYPLFWLKRAALSSKSEGSPFGGDLSGEILDVASNPALVRKPAIVRVEGDFPQQSIRGLFVKIIFDHRTETPTQSFLAKVDSFGVAGRMFSESADAQLGFRNASGSLTVEGVYNSGVINLATNGAFNKVDYIVDSNNQIIKEILTGAVKDLPVVNFKADVKGHFSDLKFNVTSNIGESLQKSFERQFKGKIDEARKQIQAAIDSKIGGPKKDLTQNLGNAEGGIKSQLDQKTKEVDKLKNLAQNKQNDSKTPGLGQGTKALEDLGKKFGF